MNYNRMAWCALLALCACDQKGSSQAAAAPKAAEPAQAKPAPAEPAAPAADDKATAKEVFATRCTPCHGAQGKGDGAASATLTPRPRDFTDPKWQDSVSDDHIDKIILYGGAAVGKSAAMPANPDFDQKPGVVKELRAHIRALKAAAH